MIANSEAVAADLMRQTSGEAGSQLDDIKLKNQHKFYEAILGRLALPLSEGRSLKHNA